MTISFFNSAMCVSAVLGLAACGGSTSNTTNITYRTFANVEPVTTPLVGNGFLVAISDAVTPQRQTATSGSITHDTRAISVGTTNGQLTDSDGADTNGVLVGDDNSSSFQHTGTINSQGFAGNYDYVVSFSQLGIFPPPPNALFGPTGSSTTGYLGVATDAGDVPTTGTAQFTGEALGEGFVTADAQTMRDWGNQAATLDADFGAGTMALTTTRVANGHTDVLTASGMTITGATFGGGTVTMTRDGTALDATSIWSTAQGNLFGYDPTALGPDEAGLVVDSFGNDAFVQLTVIAD